MCEPFGMTESIHHDRTGRFHAAGGGLMHPSVTTVLIVGLLLLFLVIVF